MTSLSNGTSHPQNHPFSNASLFSNVSWLLERLGKPETSFENLLVFLFYQVNAIWKYLIFLYHKYLIHHFHSFFCVLYEMYDQCSYLIIKLYHPSDFWLLGVLLIELTEFMTHPESKSSPSNPFVLLNPAPSDPLTVSHPGGIRVSTRNQKSPLSAHLSSLLIWLVFSDEMCSIEFKIYGI